MDAGALPPCAPGRVETCNGLDDDCDGRVDEELPLRPIGTSTPIRRSHEESTGDCSLCAGIRGYGAVSTSAGLLVVWQLGHEGDESRPSTFYRLLGPDGAPTTPITPIDSLTVGTSMTLNADARGALLTYCAHSPDGEGVLTRALLDPGGTPLWERPADPPRPCNHLRPRSAVDEGRIASAWIDPRRRPDDGLVLHVDVAQLDDGVSIARGEITDVAHRTPTLALAHGRIVVVQTWRDLRIHSYSLEGEALGAPSTFDDFWKAKVLPTDTGFAVHASERNPFGNEDRITILLGRSGELMGEPRRFADWLSFELLDAFAISGGAMLVALGTASSPFASGRYVITVDERGEARDQWRATEYDEDFESAVFVEHRGVPFLIYLRDLHGVMRRVNELRAWRLSCHD